MAAVSYSAFLSHSLPSNVTKQLAQIFARHHNNNFTLLKITSPLVADPSDAVKRINHQTIIEKQSKLCLALRWYIREVQIANINLRFEEMIVVMKFSITASVAKLIIDKKISNLAVKIG